MKAETIENKEDLKTNLFGKKEEEKDVKQESKPNQFGAQLKSSNAFAAPIFGNKD